MRRRAFIEIYRLRFARGQLDGRSRAKRNYIAETSSILRRWLLCSTRLYEARRGMPRQINSNGRMSHYSGVVIIVRSAEAIVRGYREAHDDFRSRCWAV